ncbi:hypothetical protein C8Q74DRAFT_1355372 [Fomes fomentarius]|nr:hypothetical protein C8Q74DRAFT_1355372 [Fomes fomentarius]
MDASEFGRLGALSLLRSLPSDSVVTSYPIDDEEITIGRDQACSLRLYYPAVSAMHAKITFVERKAFLVVLGTNGVLLDDSPLFPAAATALRPTTVPLQNNSVIEIHKKRFRFTYPPKHLRPALINTPTQATPHTSRRPLRLSMIASAHVFTPGPSQNPEENLRVLQTPLRTPFAREHEEIVLVHSDSPRVVQEDKDLVIIDEVESEPVLPLPLPVMPQYPVTPVRRQPRASLHRAVLIRSAHRAAIQLERQQEEEEQEAEEVEETIAAITEEADEEIEEIPPPEGHREVSGWRKSLDMVKGSLGWALRGLSVEPKEEDQELDFDAGYTEEQDEWAENGEEPDYEPQEEDEDEQQYAYEDEQHDTYETEPQRALGNFMTPQIPRSAYHPRLSLGVAPQTGPRRVRVVAPWKVGEVGIPTVVKEENNVQVTASAPAPPSTPRSPVKKEKLTEEEREAIRARRRSALTTPDNFFKGQTPGSRRMLFPNLAPLPSPSFSSQIGEIASTSSSQSQSSVLEGASSSDLSSAASAPKVEDEGEDTAVLLARMKQMVEGVKQRQSLGRQSLSLSPRKREGGFSLLAPNHASTHRPSRILIEEDESDVPIADDRDEEEPAVQTPQMYDLRHVFSRPQAEASTPVLAGVKEMFRARPAVETPRMDGVREMLETPAGYRAPSPAGPEQEREDEPAEQVPVRNARGKRTPATRIARRTAVPQSAPPKSTRAASQALEETESGEAEATQEVRGRRTRARTADGAVGQVPRATRGKAGAKPATPEPQEDEEEPEPEAQPVAVPAPARATRRTRQATDSSAASTTEEAAPADTKPARKTRAKTPTAVPASTTKTIVVRRGTRAKPIEVTEDDNDDDPLDSLPRERTPSGDAAAAPTGGRARRGGRSRAAVKQEDAEGSIPAEEEQPARTTRARRTPVPKIPVATTTSTTTTGRGGRTRAATASSAVSEPTIPEDKENTPEPSTEDDAEETKGAGVGSKARGAAKSTRGGKGSGKSTPSDVGEEPGAPTTATATMTGTRTRVGRTRAAKA